MEDKTSAHQNHRETTVPQKIIPSNNKLLVAVVISVLVTAVTSGLTVYFWQKAVHEKDVQKLNKKNTSLRSKISLKGEENAIQRTTLSQDIPSITTQSIHQDQIISNLKEYVNKDYNISINYPDNWTLTAEINNDKFSGLPDQLTITLDDNIPLQKPGFKSDSSNRAVIYNDIHRRNIEKNLEEASQSLIDYTLKYIPVISYNSPKIINVSKINLNNQPAIRYIVRMEKPKEYAYSNDELYIYHIYYKNRLWSVELYGDNKTQLNQILSSFKFID